MSKYIYIYIYQSLQVQGSPISSSYILVFSNISHQIQISLFLSLTFSLFSLSHGFPSQRRFSHRQALQVPDLWSHRLDWRLVGEDKRGSRNRLRLRLWASRGPSFTRSRHRSREAEPCLQRGRRHGPTKRGLV